MNRSNSPLFVTAALTGLVGLSSASFAQPASVLPFFSTAPIPLLSKPRASAIKAFETPEYNSNYGLASIGAATAYALGFTGAGQLVAVVDTGIDPGHPEFAGRISSASEILGVGGPLKDFYTHGTHVAGIIAANQNSVGMEGVAYGSTILALGAVGVPDASVDEAIHAATRNHASVLNGSYGPRFSSPYLDDGLQPNPNYVQLTEQPLFDSMQLEHDAIKAAERKGMLLVFAAGNERRSQPIISVNPSGAGLYPYIKPSNAKSGVYDAEGGPGPDFSDVGGPLIVVVATDRNNKIADFSNLCGVAAAWCIAAPGVDIYSTLPGDRYGNESGTSMAAPMVAGAAAVLRQDYPFLTATQIAQTLFTTATNIGPASTYGWGLLNLAKAVYGPGQFTSDWTVDTGGNSGQFSNDIAGIGGLTKQGHGTLVLSGSDTYAGATHVVGGTLEVDGSVTSPVSVLHKGSLSGSGLLANIDIQAGGTLSPGSGDFIATMTSSGSVSFAPGSHYRVKVTDHANDRLNVGGNTTIGGGTVNAVIGGGTYGRTTSATIITSSSAVTGRFNEARTSSAFLTAKLAYTPTTVSIGLNRNSVSFGAVARTPNELAVGTAIEAASDAFVLDRNVAESSGEAKPKKTENNILFSIASETAASARNEEDTLSGQGLTGAANASFQASTQFTNIITMQSNGFNVPGLAARTTVPAIAPLMPLAYADGDVAIQDPIKLREVNGLTMPVWSAWTVGFGGGQTFSDNAGRGTFGQTNDLAGGAAGLDYQVSPDLLIGVAGGGSSGSFSVPGALTTGSATGGHGGVYAFAKANAFYSAANVAYSGFSNTTKRRIGASDAEGGETDQGSFSSQVIRSHLEVGRRFELPAAARVANSITPFVAFEIAKLRSDGFTEQAAAGGPGALGLTVPGQGLTSAPSFLGVRLDGTYQLSDDTHLSPFLSAAFVHEFSPARTLSASLTALPGTAFLVDGAEAASNSAEVIAGFDLALTKRTTVFASFNGTFADSANTYAGNGGIRIVW